MTTSAPAFPEHVFAVETESDGIHNHPICKTLVVWGRTNKGNRARFDYPSLPDGHYINHHITCAGEPKERIRDVMQPEDLTFACDECELSIFRGGVLCLEHWREFRRWISLTGHDAFTVWQRGDRDDRRTLLLGWMELREVAA